MNSRKEVKSAFTALLDRAASPDWAALKKGLPEQQFKPSTPTLFKRSYRRQALASVSLLLVAVTILGVFVLSRPDSTVKQAVTAAPVPTNNSASADKAALGSERFGNKNDAIKSANNSTSIAESTANLPMMPAEPVVLDCNGSLYITNSVFGDKATAKPGKRIGSIAFGGDVPVCAVKSRPLAKSICILSTYNGSKSYLRYDYLSKDFLSAGGRTYRITSASRVLSGESAAGSKSSASGYKLRWIYLYSSPSVRQATKAILRNKLGDVPSGAIYAIKQIDPENAVCLNLGSRWFYLKKQSGYKGKTIDEVMAENGFTQVPMN